MISIHIICFVARSISSAYTAMMEPLGLTGPQSRVIAYVDRYPGITQVELCEYLGLGSMAITGIIDRMEAKCLVKRAVDPADRRVRRIYLTDEALLLRPEMDEIIQKLRSQVESNISREDMKTFVDVLKRIEANLSEPPLLK